MKKRTRQVCAIVATQTVCLAVGLWAQYRYTVSTVKNAAIAQCYADLTTDGAGLLDRLGTAGLAAISDRLSDHTIRETMPRQSQFATTDRLAHLLEPIRLRHGRIVVADENWQVRYRVNWENEASEVASIVWEPTSMASLGSKTWSQGRFRFGKREYVGIARTMPHHAGYLLLAQDLGEINRMTATLVAALPFIGGLTMVWLSILLTIAVYMLWTRLHRSMDEQQSRSVNRSFRQVQDLVRTRDAVIFGLAKLADSRDPETGEHLERISVYSTLLTTAAARDPKFQRLITPSFARLIGISSSLHDVGKVGVEDRILKKPGRLTPEEFRMMQEHANIGGDCLREIEHRLGSSNFLQLAREIAYAHHENWDGSGYPRGLAGTNIPLAARIVSIADVYDALSCRRVYKEPFPHEECVRIIRSEAGKKFDADLVRVWLTIESKFAAVARQFGVGVSTDGSPKTSTTGSQNEQNNELCVVTSGATEE